MAKREIYFKIFDLKDRQVLVMRDFDNEETPSKPLMVISFFEKGLKLNIKIGFEKEKDRNKSFNDLNEKNVQGIIANVLKEFK